MKKLAVVIAALITLIVGGPLAVSNTPTAQAADTPAVKIMPLGDSITWGSGNWDATAGAEGYRRFLQLRLASAGFNFDMVGSQNAGTLDGDNEGHPGYTIATLGAEALGPTGWIAKAKPDVILLQIGTNDVTRSIPNAPYRLGQLIDAIHKQNPQTTIFVAKIARRQGPATAYKYQDYLTYDEGVQTEVNRRIAAGLPLVLVDNSIVSGCLSDYYDYVHLDWTGYQKMAFNWYIALAGRYGASSWPLGQNPYTAYPCS